MSHVQGLYGQIGFLFDTDDGSLPEVRLTGLPTDRTPAVYARVRALATRINEGAYFWERRAEREAPIDSVPNAASLVIAGHADAFHFVLQDPRSGEVALPKLGVFVCSDEIALDYRMGPEWGAKEIAALVELLCELQRLAPGSRVELEAGALPAVQVRFARAIAEFCSELSNERK